LPTCELVPRTMMARAWFMPSMSFTPIIEGVSL
jgi:hypothetical protein